jgi:dipeptidyl aminopeptidase/acylaminoacyl peptidase/predicted Ser/Thr protein kinase
MSLSPGTKLGPYEILAPLGAGGMGEVYRARDAKLGREIAIKVLSETTASDPDRRQRFELEARAASALNHPNILTVHDIGEADGSLYIAMELVEGKTLRELVASGEPLPTKKLLDVAVQTAEGLAKAHAAGIVHRDLKPENLMVSKDGYVKILDFGLAKLTETVSQDASVLPTAIAAPTQPGTVMGTAGYMSPEQASGQPVDYRSDQFTLGAILYEMATGKRAFQRKTGAETLVAIIREEPEPLSQAAPKAPAPVRWIVERLLAKDPEERYASSKDLARDLKSVRDHLTETSLSGGLEAAEPAKARRRGWLAPALLALVLGAALGALLLAKLGGNAAPAIQFQQLTFQRGQVLSARFAPDGQTIVYSAAWEGRPPEIFTTRPDSAESRSLGLTGAIVLAVSSAGEVAVSLNRHFIIGYEATGTLARVPLAGGSPREVLESAQDVDWSPDGKEMAVCRFVGNRSRLEYPIGKVLYEAAKWVRNVSISPDGRLLAFVDCLQRGNNDGRLKIVDTSGKLRLDGPLVKGNGGLAWSPRGDEVWFGRIEAVSLDGKVRPVWTSPMASLEDRSRDGRVLLSEFTARREMVGFGRDGVPHNLTALNWSFPSDISADGDTVLFYEQIRQPPGVYVRKLDGSPAVRLADGEGYGFSPDGRWALTAKLPERRPIMLVPTGAGEPKTLDIGNLAFGWGNWFPDGRRILIGANEPGRGPRLFVQDLSGGKPRPISAEGVSITMQAISPDGRSIVARGPDGRIAIYPSEAGGEPRPVPGIDPEDMPLRWTADGRSLYVTRFSALPGIINIVDIATGRRTPWKKFQPLDPSGVEQAGPAMISPDGTTYVYSFRRVLGDLFLATGMR